MSAAVENSKLLMNRAKTIAAMGMVERDYDGFNVVSPGINKETFRVWRDEDNRIRCSCSEFQERAEQEPRFRCEHIFAVKFHLEPPDEEKRGRKEGRVCAGEWKRRRGDRYAVCRNAQGTIASRLA